MKKLEFIISLVIISIAGLVIRILPTSFSDDTEVAFEDVVPPDCGGECWAEKEPDSTS